MRAGNNRKNDQFLAPPQTVFDKTNIMNIQLYNEDNLEVMKRLPDESIDVICIDPPYLYLKNQKLERPFDERLFFSECKRLLTKNGFIVMFGRGTSFYRWNTILEDLKFTFKEEIVWDKTMNSIPAAPVLRTHELIIIFTKNNGKLNTDCRIPYLEAKKHNIDGIIQDIKRIKSAINSKEFNDIEHFLKNNKIIYTEKKSQNFFKNSYGERSRGLATIRTIQNGMKEKTIMKQTRDHYTSIHPTQKPVRLLERLLKLVIPMKSEKIVIADFFSGSASCAEAVINLQSEFPDKNFDFIGTEIDREYFDAGKNRISKLKTNNHVNS